MYRRWFDRSVEHYSDVYNGRRPNVYNICTISFLIAFSRGTGGYERNFWKFRRGGGGLFSFTKMEIPERWGVLAGIPSVVEVWIFSGTAHCVSRKYKQPSTACAKITVFFIYIKCMQSDRAGFRRILQF